MKIARDVELPADAVTQTFAFVGRKGSGKTFAAGVLAEGFLEAGVQVVVLDPVGNWYGLRLGKSGKSRSPFAIPIIGGEHGDLPLEAAAGSVVADFVVQTGSSAVLDVSHFRKGQRKTFVAEFAEQLFHAKKGARTPMHLVIEETQVFAPQRAGKGEERMLGAIEDIVRLGRNYGIGCSMISQRPQSINKEVLNQAEPLVVFQLVAKHERDAVRNWMEHVGAEAAGMLDELPSLETGDCFLWSPAWLRRFLRTRFRAKRTYDASATPRLGEEPPKPVELKPVDMTALESAIGESVERARADDPKRLRKRIAELEAEVARPAEPLADEAAIEAAVASAVEERDAYWRGELEGVERIARDRYDRLVAIGELAATDAELAGSRSGANSGTRPTRPPRSSAGAAPSRPIPPNSSSSGNSGSRAEPPG
ncbi:MAG: DUF87 domain-containing protein [Actinomycetota bacterium]